MVLAPKEGRNIARRAPFKHSDFCPYFRHSLLKRRQQELKETLEEER